MNEATENEGLIYEFGKFVLDPRERVLLADGEQIHLADKVFDTLCLLIQNNGKLLTKDEMMASIWEESFVEESNLAKNVSRLRKILNSGDTQFIETIPRRGYRFRADVKQMEAGTDLLVHRHLRIKLTHTSTKDDETQATQIFDRETGAIHSIAVLPFQPLDGNDLDDVFGLGLTDALITQMNRGGQLQVRPTSAILKYNVSGRDPVSAGRELQVNAVLEGKFQRNENKLRLTVQLLRTAGGASLWADSFDTEVQDIFTVQDHIAERVITSLTRKLTDEALTRIKTRYTENVDAYREYLRGRGFWNKRTMEDYHRALECFQNAIDIDPLYALAYAGMADIYNLLPLYDGVAPRDSFPKAKAAALKALFIDGNLAEAHSALGLAILHYDWNWSGAESSFRNAIKLDPNYPAAYQLLGVYLCRVDRISEAIIALKEAQERDPLSPINATWLAEVLRYYGETEASIKLHKETLKSFPDFFIAHYHLAFSYIDRGRFEEAEYHRERAVSLSNENSLTLSLQGILQAAVGNTAGVQETLDKLLRMKAEKYISSANIASVYAASGAKEKAIEWLETAVTERDPNLTWIKFDKEFRSLAPDPRFQNILREIGLADTEVATKALLPAVQKPRSKWLVPVMAAMVVLLVVVGLWYLNRDAVIPTSKINSIAVLPLRSLTTEENNKALGLGLTDALITRLGSLRTITVRPTSAVAKFVATEEDALEIGRRLNVDAVVEGTIQQSGDRLRINARLLRVASGEQLWTENFDESAANIFSLQDALSSKIARTLFFELSNADKTQLARRPTQNVEAYEKYLRGRFYQNQNTEQGLTKAVEFYEQAIALDGQFADAHAGLADALLILYNFGLRPPDEIVPRAKQSLSRALQLDPNLSDAYSALALIQFLSEHDQVAAERTLQRAMELNPNNADAYLRYGYFLTAEGRFDDALVKLEKALQLNPLSPIIKTDIGLTHLCARRYGTAIDQFEKVIAENPDVSLPRWFLGTSYDANQEPDKAFAAYLRANELEGGAELSARLDTLQRSSGKQAAYQLWLDESLKLRKQGYYPAINIAFLYAAMKNREQTVAWLEKAFDEHEPTFWQIKYLPNYDFARDDPRFQEMLRKVNL